MNTDKAKRLLKKVQALFDNFNDQGSMSTLERDLLLSYLRELYEDLSTSASTPARINEPQRESPFEPSEFKGMGVDSFPIKPLMPRQEWKEPPTPIVTEPVHTRTEPIISVQREPAVAHTASNVVHTPTPLTTPVHETSVDVDPMVDSKLTKLFEFKEVGELAEKLKLQPIERIEHGMGINERILSINELFNGDHDLFKKSLDYLNALTNFRDAQMYLIDGVASQFNWADEAKKDKATYFIQLVRRRFVGK